MQATRHSNPLEHRRGPSGMTFVCPLARTSAQLRRAAAGACATGTGRASPRTPRGDRARAPRGRAPLHGMAGPSPRDQCSAQTSAPPSSCVTQSREFRRPSPRARAADGLTLHRYIIARRPSGGSASPSSAPALQAPRKDTPDTSVRCSRFSRTSRSARVPIGELPATAPGVASAGRRRAMRHPLGMARCSNFNGMFLAMAPRRSSIAPPSSRLARAQCAQGEPRDSRAAVARAPTRPKSPPENASTTSSRAPVYFARCYGVRDAVSGRVSGWTLSSCRGPASVSPISRRKYLGRPRQSWIVGGWSAQPRAGRCAWTCGDDRSETPRDPESNPGGPRARLARSPLLSGNTARV